MGGAVKAVTRPFKKVANAVKKGVSSTFKAVKKVGDKIGSGIRSAGRKLDKFVDKKLGGWANVATGGLAGAVKGAKDTYDALNQDIPDPKDPAPPAPTPEQYAEDFSRPENISRRKRNRRNGLRIDLNTGGAPSGNGVNLPVG